MKTIMKGTRNTAEIMLALLGGILMPILIWVAFGVAISQKLRARVPQRKVTPTIGEILSAAGLTIEGKTATGESVAARVFGARSGSALDSLLANAGLNFTGKLFPRIVGKSCSARWRGGGGGPPPMSAAMCLAGSRLGWVKVGGSAKCALTAPYLT